MAFGTTFAYSFQLFQFIRHFARRRKKKQNIVRRDFPRRCGSRMMKRDSFSSALNEFANCHVKLRMREKE